MEQYQKNEQKELSFESLYDVSVDVSVVLGSKVMTLNDVLRLNKGTVLELDTNIGEPVELCVNGKPVAKGEIVVIDNKIGVSLTEIFGSKK